jgi:methylglutaconyl-CoA hydratase
MPSISNFDNVIVQHDARGIATITLNRPHKRNAFDAELIANLQQLFSHLSNDDAIRAVVLTGAQTTFCSGMDLDHMRQLGSMPQEDNINDALALANMLKSLKQLCKPVIARVNGNAFGGALGLIAAADIAIAIDSAQFAFTEVRLGLVPAVIAPYVLAAIGERQTLRWFLSGTTFSAQQAFEMGLLHAITSASDFDDAIENELEQLLKGGPNALSTAKQLLNELNPLNSPDDKQALAIKTASLLAELRASAEGKEGLAAFNERRPPRWQ